MAVALPVFAAMAVIGTSIAAYGAIQQGNAMKQVGEQNARIARKNAEQADLYTADQLSQLNRRTDILLGKQKAGYAKAGVKREGTPLELLIDTVNAKDRDAFRIRQSGQFMREGALFSAQQAEYQGEVAQRQSYIGAGSTLLTGFAQTGLSYKLGQGYSMQTQ